MPDSKKVLLIAPYFIPRRRVGSLRPFKFAIHLSSLGYKPIVLTIGHRPDLLTPKERLLLGSIEILSIDSPLDRTSKSKKIGKTSDQNKKSLIESFLTWVDRNCPTDTWISLFILRWKWIKRVVTDCNPDLIMATGDPWSGLWLGEKLSKKLHIPFIADFRDPWTLSNIRLRERSFFSAGVDKIIERKVVESADRLIFTSQQTNALYSEKYKIPSSKTATLYNSFEPALMKKKIGNSKLPVWDPDMVNILFLGCFRRLSSAAAILDILKNFQSSHPKEIRMLRIHSFGEPEKDEIENIKHAGFISLFVFHDPFEPEESLPIMNSADLLLLSTSKERSDIIPAKLWDYLFSDVPILSIIPNPEVGKIVRNRNAGVHFSPENVHEIVDFLLCVILAKQTGSELPAPIRKDVDGIQQYTSKAATNKLVTIFDDLLNTDQN